MKLFVRSLPSWASVADLFVLLYADNEHSFWLDREHQAIDRFSVLGASDQVYSAEQVNFGRLRQLVEGFAADSAEPVPFAFRPGLVGFLGYEGEAQFLLVDRAVVFDHDANVTYFIGNFEQEPDFDAWYHAALLRLALVGGERAAYRMRHDRKHRVHAISQRHSQHAYLELIDAARAHIATGNAYQLCLTNRISLELDADPLNVFLRLREASPAPYAAFVKLGSRAVVCSSPEQFLKVSVDKLATSKPIKGTRARSDDPITDAQNAEALRANEKERAENLMIVDLMRNDLGRVCEPDSVQVPSLFEVESYATVHQLVSTVTGRLRPEVDAIDAIESTFPAGSMTGAPKLRAIELLSELEGGPRGVFSGVVGYLGADGSADFGMVIRTIVFEKDTAYIGVGGGIMADSEPAAEYLETMLKAKALLEVLGAPLGKLAE